MHLGLIGYGSIATSLIGLLTDTSVAQVTVLVRPGSDPVTNSGAIPVRFVTSIEALTSTGPDLVVECAGHGAVAGYVPALLKSGLDVIVASVGALADQDLCDQIYGAAREGQAQVILPSGAIGGLDILRAVSQTNAVDLNYRGIKPPQAWKGSPAEDFLDLDALGGAETFFTGTGREAALAFPKNANVVAALALAGGGFDQMRVALIADPNAVTNQHSYTVVSPHCTYSMTIEAAPSAGNARTSFTTVLSILREITDYRIAR